MVLKEKEQVMSILYQNSFTEDLQLALVAAIKEGHSADLIKEALYAVADESLICAYSEKQRIDAEGLTN